MKYDMRKEPATIRCDQDGCGWETEITFDQMGEWCQEPCPGCGAGIIINGKEISTAAMVIGMGFLGLVAPKGSNAGKLVRLDTSKLDACRPQPEAEKAKTLKEVRRQNMEKWSREFFSDWIADLAAKDEGRIFHNAIRDESFAPVTYGDLRKLARQDNEINEVIKEQPEGGG